MMMMFQEINDEQHRVHLDFVDYVDYVDYVHVVVLLVLVVLMFCNKYQGTTCFRAI